MIERTPDGGVSCLNCGRPAGPRFCGQCGQAVDDRRGPLVSLVRELVEESLSLDGRMLTTIRTLPRPGLLTRLYLDGKRVSFLGPLRLYLFASLVLFSSLLALPTPKAAEVDLYIGDDLVTAGPASADRPDIRIMSSDSTGAPWLATRMAGNLARMRQLPPQEILDRFFAGLRSALPIALILFLPFLAGALKLLYIRKRVLYVDHLVFGVHVQSALLLALAATWLLARLAGFGLTASVLAYIGVFLLMLTVYLALALRRVYGQRWRMTIPKTLALLLAYVALLLQGVVGPAIVLVLFRL